MKGGGARNRELRRTLIHRFLISDQSRKRNQPFDLSVPLDMGQVAGQAFAPEQSFLPLTAPGDAASVFALSHVAALFSLQHAFFSAHDEEQDLPLTAPGAVVF